VFPDRLVFFVGHYQDIDVSLVGKWLAASNLAATFDLSVHNLWTLTLQSDGTFKLVGVETVSYPHSGRQGHQSRTDIMSGKWAYSTASSKVTLMSPAQYHLRLSALQMGGKLLKLLHVEGYLPSVMGPMGTSPVFSLEASAE
jgi:hypothetical protein